MKSALGFSRFELQLTAKAAAMDTNSSIWVVPSRYSQFALSAAILKFLSLIVV